MKSSLFLLAFAVFFTSCREEDQLSTNEVVQFTLGVADTDDGRRIEDFPEVISAEIALESSAGKTIVKSLDFTKTADLFISEPLEIPAGNYKINDIVIRDESIAVIHRPLQSLFIQGNTLRKISIGRAAFAARSLVVAVYTEQQGKSKLTSAKVTIYDNERRTYIYERSAKMHHVVFKGNPDASYTLKIEKEGYEVYANTFVYNQLQRKRLAITLQKKAAESIVTFKPSATDFWMVLHVMGKGTLTLDWGLGETERLEFDVDPENETATAYFVREQAYATEIPPAKLTGDVHLLAGIYFEAAVDALQAEDATALQRLVVTDSDMPILDLRHNTALTALTFTNSSIVELILPQRHLINELWIQSYSPTAWPSTSDMDYIIANIHANAVVANIRNGSMNFDAADVSEQSAPKLLELKNTYGWQVPE